MLPSEHIKDLLVSLGYKWQQPTAAAWDVWIGKQPSSPDRAITIYDSGGRPANPRWLIDYPSIQIRVRGGQNDYQSAYLKAQEVSNLLVGRDSYTATNGDRIVSIGAVGGIAHTGWDDKDRPEFVFNLALIIEPDDSTPGDREPL